MSVDMRMERRVPTQMRSVRRFGVRSELVYFSRGMGYRQPSSLGVPRIDVSRHSIRLAENKAFKSVSKGVVLYFQRLPHACYNHMALLVLGFLKSPIKIRTRGLRFFSSVQNSRAPGENYVKVG